MKNENINLNRNEASLIANALNLYFHDAYKNLQRKDLGIIEKEQYEKRLELLKPINKKFANYF